MPSRQFPGMNLLGGWNTGEPDWGGAMNANLRRLSAVAGARVLSRQTTIPTTGDPGDIFLVPQSAISNANNVALWDVDGSGNPAWVYLTPQIGWHFFVVDEEINVQWDGDEWVQFAGAGGGGGGGTGQSYMLPSNQLPALGGLTYSSSSYATKGMIYEAEARLAIHRIDFDVDDGGTYKAVLALVSGANNTISSIIHESTEVTPGDPGRISFGINDGIVVNAGAKFAALLVRTDGTGTTAAEVGTAATPGPETPHISVLGYVEAEEDEPGVSDDLGSEASGSVAAVALVYTLEADGGTHLPVRDVYINQPVIEGSSQTSTSANTANFAIKASIFTFTETMRLNQIYMWISAAAGSTYRLFVGRVDGSNNLTELFSLTDSFSGAATGEYLAFDGSLQVGPGDRIIIGMMRTDGTGTTPARPSLTTFDTNMAGWELIHSSAQARNTLELSDSFPSTSATAYRIRAIYTRSGFVASLLYDRLILDEPEIPDSYILNLQSADFRGNKVIKIDDTENVVVNVPFGLVAIQPITFARMGVGGVFFEAADGVTILAPDGADGIRARYGMATLMPMGGNTYLLGCAIA